MKVNRGKTGSHDEKGTKGNRECSELLKDMWPEETELVSSLLEYELCSSMDALERELSSPHSRKRRIRT
jgi:hypothetical protein